MNPDDTNTAPVNEEPTQDDKEWDQALDDYKADKLAEKVEPSKKAEEQDKGTEGGEPEKKPEPTADEATKAAELKRKADEAEAEMVKTETPEETKARHELEANIEKNRKEAEENPPNKDPGDPAFRQARQTQRQIAEAERIMKEDIRKELFSDVQTELLDADGDPIRTIEDVQKLLNPNTQQPFTEEEAASYLLQAQQHLNKTKQEAEAKIEKIASVNLDLIDQADNIKVKYGALLQAMPDVANRIVAAYNKTLITDPKSGTIIDAPVNMEEFFEIALDPYQKVAEETAKATEAEEKAKEAEEKAKKDAAEAKKKQTRQDRSDIYGGGKTETMDDDEKEWAEAAKVVYGDK